MRVCCNSGTVCRLQVGGQSKFLGVLDDAVVGVSWPLPPIPVH